MKKTVSFLLVLLYVAACFGFYATVRYYDHKWAIVKTMVADTHQLPASIVQR